MMYDVDESGYDLSDPKHPTYAERMFDRADERRKREREEPPGPTKNTTPQAAAIVAHAKLRGGAYGIGAEGTGVIHNQGSAFDAVAAALARGRDHRLYRMADGWRYIGIVHADGRFTDERPER